MQWFYQFRFGQRHDIFCTLYVCIWGANTRGTSTRINRTQQRAKAWIRAKGNGRSSVPMCHPSSICPHFSLFFPLLQLMCGWCCCVACICHWPLVDASRTHAQNIKTNTNIAFLFFFDVQRWWALLFGRVLWSGSALHTAECQIGRRADGRCANHQIKCRWIFIQHFFCRFYFPTLLFAFIFYSVVVGCCMIPMCSFAFVAANPFGWRDRCATKEFLCEFFCFILFSGFFAPLCMYISIIHIINCNMCVDHWWMPQFHATNDRGQFSRRAKYNGMPQLPNRFFFLFVLFCFFSYLLLCWTNEF